MSSKLFKCKKCQKISDDVMIKCDCMREYCRKCMQSDVQNDKDLYSCERCISKSKFKSLVQKDEELTKTVKMIQELFKLVLSYHPDKASHFASSIELLIEYYNMNSDADAETSEEDEKTLV